MTIAELRCPSCSAPLGAASRDAQVCRYCGATVVATLAPSRSRTEERFSVIARVGPSNVARVASLIERHAGVATAEAEALARRTPCEVDAGNDEGGARSFARALEEAGASVEIARRIVTVPIPPDVAVLLDDVGSNKFAVIHALREHADMGVSEAKRLVENAPCVLVDTTSAARGQALLAALLAAGARARVREHS